jgi:hypothetical protein
MIDIDKHSSLLQYRTDYGRKHFYRIGPADNTFWVRSWKRILIFVRDDKFFWEDHRR